MKPLLRVMLVLGLLFASTFAIAKVTGFLSIEQVKSWFETLKETSAVWKVVLVIGLQFADLFVAVPNLTVAILSGYFLGFPLGSSASIVGMLLAGVVGYAINYRLGDKALGLMLRDEEQRKELKSIFLKSGFAMILLSRALPILPEVTACLAGMTKMSFPRFLLAWSLNTFPYALIAGYSGSISSPQDPKPALFVAVGISGILWLCWYFFSKGISRNS